MIIKTGTYTGDGVAGHAITGLGFKPEAVLLIGDATVQLQIATRYMSGKTKDVSASAQTLKTDRITSLDSDGFTVGSDIDVNNNGSAYHYIAMADNGLGDFKVGSYVGTGANPNDVTSVGFQPDVAIVCGDNAAHACYKLSSLGTGTAFFTNQAATITALNSFLSNGWRLSTNTAANQAGVIYHYIAMKETANAVEVPATYTGDGADDRSITGVGFQPDVVITRKISGSGREAIIKINTIADPLSYSSNGSNGVLGDGIQALEADGFQVGTDIAVNDPTRAFFPVAFKSITSAPSVSTGSASAILANSATISGSITVTGGVVCTVRGFQWNTTPNETGATTITENGSFYDGSFSANLTSLTSETTYYYRVYATNANGTTYGSWEAFDSAIARYRVIIDGEERTDDIIVPSLVVEDYINDQNNTCSFQLIDRNSSGLPEAGEEVIIYDIENNFIFSGYITSVRLGGRKETGLVMASYTCVDQVWLLDRNLVHQTFENMTDKEVIEEIIETYCSGFGITTTNVIEGVTIDQISFNYLQPSQCFRRIADLTGRNWYIDYEKDVHYFPLATETAPFNITSSNNEYFDLNISKDLTQLKNRVYVRGGTKLSDFTTFSEKGDGSKRKFSLPDKPHDVSVTVNAVSKTVGIKNIDTSGFDWYLNFQEKYLEQDSGGSTLTSSDTLSVQYKYDIPILIAQEDTDSIAENGVKEFAIFDKTITTTQAARDRAVAELTDYANNLIEGSFKTYTTGFKSGQYLTINLSEYGVNDQYIVQSVISRSLGAGTYIHEIKIASAKTMGIIRFLIELLESNKNIVELDDNETVDELLTSSDNLISDSLLDSLIMDSQGPNFTWCVSNESTPKTRMVWGLFQWG